MISDIIRKYRDINWALADQALVSGVNFLTGILFARYLGIEEYGRFTLAWMAVLFFNSFQQTGIIAPMMSIGPKQDRGKEAAYYGAVFIQQLIWSAACFILLLVSVWSSGFIKPEWHIQNLALSLAATLFAWQLQDFIRRYYFVRNQGGRAFLNDVISYLGQLILLVVLFRQISLNTVIVLWLIAGTSTVAVTVGLFSFNVTCPSIDILIKTIRQHWHFSKWLLASTITQWACGNVFIVAAGSMLGVKAVGGIKAAQNIIGVMNIIFNSADMIVHSGASRAYYRGGITSLKKYLLRITVQGGGATFALISIIYIFSEQLLILFYGSDFKEYTTILHWFCPVYMLSFFGYPLAAGLRALERTRIIFLSMLVMSLISILSVKFFVGYWQLQGVVFGMMMIKAGMISFFSYDLFRSFSLMRNKS